MACGGEHREERQSMQYLPHCAGPTSSLFGREFDGIDHRFASLVALVDGLPCSARFGEVHPVYHACS